MQTRSLPARRAKATRLLLFSLLLPLTAAASAVAADDIPSRPLCRGAGNPAIRSRSPLASAAMQYGLKRSPSMQALVDALQETDVVAYVDSDLKPLGDVWGHVAFISKTSRCRYVRIAITAHVNLAQAAALLAHELQHVLEIASHPEVVDDATLSEMYLRYGKKSRYENSYDSVEAMEMGTRVAAEIYNGGVAPSARSSPAEPAR